MTGTTYERLIRCRTACIPLLLFTLYGAPASAAPCPAALDMNKSLDVLERRTDLLQRREWLMLEYLASDGSKKSRKLLDKEVANSQARATVVIEHAKTLASMPAAATPLPEEGTPDCETITRAKTAIDELMALREKEVAELTEQTYPFLSACDVIATDLVNVGAKSRKEGSSSADALLRMSVGIVLGPHTHRARMNLDDLDRLTGELFVPTSLSPRTLTAFGALRCLRNYQRAAVKPLTEATPALAECPTLSWSTLGLCVAAATKP